MEAAQARRDHLRRELAQARAAKPPAGVDMLPTAVRKIVSDLRGMLEAGQVEQVNSALSRLVTSIEVHEDPRPGRKRPGANLLVRGNLEALLQMSGEVTSDGSPGGIWALLTVELPPKVIALRRRDGASSTSVGRGAPQSALRAGCWRRVGYPRRGPARRI